MNREDIIKLAREAGFKVDWQHTDVAEIKSKRYEHFAALVAAAEREACAKVCEDIDTEYEGEDVLATWCANAIRARGQA
jgi:fido (protein-threonine AMPylation protein)